MNRNRQIRDIYFELRRALPGAMSPLDVLECAALVVENFTDARNDPVYDARTGGVPFDYWSLDRAFADGGWRVLGHETRVEEEMLREDRLELRTHNGMARLALELTA